MGSTQPAAEGLLSRLSPALILTMTSTRRFPSSLAYKYIFVGYNGISSKNSGTTLAFMWTHFFVGAAPTVHCPLFPLYVSHNALYFILLSLIFPR